jgi:DNA-binding transcriptional regulator YiaG
MIGFLIEEYLEQHQINIKAFANRLGFTERQVRNWINRKSIPRRFSAECLLILFLTSQKLERELYIRYFWDIWRLEQNMK